MCLKAGIKVKKITFLYGKPFNLKTSQWWKKKSKSKVSGTHDPKDMLTAYKSIIIMF